MLLAGTQPPNNNKSDPPSEPGRLSPAELGSDENSESVRQRRGSIIGRARAAGGAAIGLRGTPSYEKATFDEDEGGKSSTIANDCGSRSRQRFGLLRQRAKRIDYYVH
uniref:Uncharacterized protein n=1 Tax=Prymnesium polylepis TaxID=72548 RepID=A0A7S4JSA7_9EUKA|mmetsp:Transcript_5592/g.14530  ORF Transcript_5592/g.14530 Transcript_5592/m.14530 type:complete len:108 (+) Transcript_5592:30-353(+)